jgi:hypothetical protein
MGDDPNLGNELLGALLDALLAPLFRLRVPLLGISVANGTSERGR